MYKPWFFVHTPYVRRLIMDKKLERLLILLMAFAFVFLLFSGSFKPAEGSESQSLENQFNGIIRFHVIANSDSAEDQDLKLKVRDYVLERLQKNLAAEMEEKEASMGEDFSEILVMRKYIESNLEVIEAWAKEGLELYDSEYGCTASLGVRHIPAKYYDDILFPEGNYEALTITIGEGKGQNWWCVVFPPLCLVDNEDSPYTDKLDISESDKIQLKFKLIEIMKDIYAQRAIDVFFCVTD